MSSKKSKILVAVLVVVIAAGAAFGLSQSGEDKPEQTAQNTQVSSPEPQQTLQSEISYDGVEGKNALELLKLTHKVETKTYDGIGELVTSIDEVAPDSKHFWALYVNGTQSQVGASAYITKTTDKITWKLEEIK